MTYRIIIIIIIIIITDEYDLGGTVALLLQDHLTMSIVSHVTTNHSKNGFKQLK